MAEVKMKLKKGDQVKVIAGKDKGKTGRVLRIDNAAQRVIVEQVNMVKKHQKPRSANEKGSIVELEAALHISNVQVICKKCGPSRIGIRIDGDEKVRICRKCGEKL